MKLILIHGRDQQGKDPSVLKKEWIDTLKLGLEKSNLELPSDVDIVFPFYGDLLDSLLTDLNTTIEGVIAKGAAISKDPTFVHEFLKELAENSEISDIEIDQEYNEPYKDKGPLNWEWVQAILTALDRTPIGNLSLKRFTYDVFLYLTVDGIRKRIDEFVSTSISDGPAVVVGHSLGSVVAYNVLRQHTNSIVVKFVTVGSPLGLKSIRKKLAVPIMMPGCVADGWFNAFDERDVVALNTLDKRNFNISPEIANKNDVDNFTDNRHGIIGYLDDAEVAKVIYEALTAP